MRAHRNDMIIIIEKKIIKLDLYVFWIHSQELYLVPDFLCHSANHWHDSTLETEYGYFTLTFRRDFGKHAHIILYNQLFFILTPSFEFLNQKHVALLN